MSILFVTGIGTGVGKTIASAVLVELLAADYWKPVQSGDLDNSDTMKVRDLVSNSSSVFHEERYRLSQPLSPHRSAEIDGIRISISDFTIPKYKGTLIIEGAGGLLVPLNENALMVDLIEHLRAEVILISCNYLGSINHTLMTAEILRNRGIPLKGLIFNGKENEASESFITNYLKTPTWHIPEFSELSRRSVRDFVKGTRFPFL